MRVKTAISLFPCALPLLQAGNGTESDSGGVKLGIVILLGITILLLSSVSLFLFVSLRRLKAAQAARLSESTQAETAAPTPLPVDESPEEVEEAAPEPTLYGRLLVIKGLDETEILLNRETFTIGRTAAAGCDYAIDRPFISPAHCMISYRDNEFVIKDLGSKNGTFVNGERLLREREVIAPIGSEIEVTKNITVELWDANTAVEPRRAAKPDQETADTPHDSGELLFQPLLEVVYAEDDGGEIDDTYSPI